MRSLRSGFQVRCLGEQKQIQQVSKDWRRFRGFRRWVQSLELVASSLDAIASQVAKRKKTWPGFTSGGCAVINIQLSNEAGMLQVQLCLPFLSFSPHQVGMRGKQRSLGLPFSPCRSGHANKAKCNHKLDLWYLGARLVLWAGAAFATCIWQCDAKSGGLPMPLE